MLLEFHKWRTMKSDDEHDPVALFLFSLTPAERRRSGGVPTHEECFWTEVHFSRFLGQQPIWREMSRDEKIRAMFGYAVCQIRKARRKLRQAPMFWAPTGDLAGGPPAEITDVSFPKMEPISIDVGDKEDAPRFLTRVGAGHPAGT